MPTAVQRVARAALAAPGPAEKAASVRGALDDLAGGELEFEHPDPIEPIGRPGRPARPELVAPARLEKRRLGSPRGRACLIHAVAHIEFNAVNLALDAVYRFPGMPGDFYADWLSVAGDEVRHFEMLGDRLAAIGFEYGDFPAHDGLWEMAVKTAHSCLERMALVPRVLEARGLDVTPAMIERFEAAGDRATADVLRTILDEEVRHVAIGTRWFRYLCARQGLDPQRQFLALVEHRFAGSIKGPLNREARMAAGFERDELRLLERLGARGA